MKGPSIGVKATYAFRLNFWWLQKLINNLQPPLITKNVIDNPLEESITRSNHNLMTTANRMYPWTSTREEHLCYAYIKCFVTYYYYQVNKRGVRKDKLAKQDHMGGEYESIDHVSVKRFETETEFRLTIPLVSISASG